MLPRIAPTFTWPPPRRHWIVVCLALGVIALLTSMPERDPTIAPLPQAVALPPLGAGLADQQQAPAVSAGPATAAAVSPPSPTGPSSMPTTSTPPTPPIASVQLPRPTTTPIPPTPTPPPTTPTPTPTTTSEAAAPTSLVWVASSWLTALIVLMAVAVAYLWTVLPTLAPRRAAAATAGACAVLVFAGWALSAWADAGAAGSAMAALLVALPALTLASGHGGYALAGARRAAATTVPAGSWRESTPAAAVPLPNPLPVAEAAPVVHVPPPDRALFGNFRIEGDLGRGAMGVVYLGRHQRTGQRVALKTLSVAPDDDVDLHEAKRRFLREAALATRLRHPDIIAIVGSGEEHGQAYIAMEYVEGHDLCRHTRADALLPLPVLIDAMARVAEALAHAHGQGVIHRDIKPSNLMWNPVTRQVKVADFGVARVADGSRTSTGVLIGTPTYLAPEQLAGRKVDHRTDLYALGVTLFQLITGQAPMRAESMARLMYAIANIAAPDVRRLRPDAPPALAAIVAQLLQKQPDDRYTDGRALAADLRAVLVAGPAVADSRTTIGAPALATTGHNSAH